MLSRMQKALGAGLADAGRLLSIPGNELANFGIALHNRAVDRERGQKP